MVQSVVVHRIDGGEDWEVGPVGYEGDVPPREVTLPSWCCVRNTPSSKSASKQVVGHSD
jgi:hypothetical protein